MGEPSHLAFVSTAGCSVTLNDGSVWAIDPRNLAIAHSWLPGAPIEVRIVSSVAMWPNGLANPGDGLLVRARRST